jgi:hypothetical protein
VDLSTVVTSLVSSGIISIGAARFLTTRLIDHRLTKDLANHKAALDERLATSKSQLDRQLAVANTQLEAALHKGVEEYLGDKAADRQYRLDARKRLYAAIGPLRFQLVMACNDFAGRVERMGSGKQPYATSLAGYFGRSTAFRLLRLFGVAELIERQVAYADFSVDPSTVDLLRFKDAAFRCMSSSTIVLNHPKANWNNQVEHVFWDALSMISAAMIVNDGAGTIARVMRFDEFDKFATDPGKVAAIHPIPVLLEGFTVVSKPILWVRFITLAHLCNSFVRREGPALGITADSYDGAVAFRASTDDFVKANCDKYCEMLQRVISPIAAAPVT